MKLVEVHGQMINTEYITNIWYDYSPGGSSIEITMLNGNKIPFPVSDRKEYEEIVRKLNPTEDINIIECAKKVRDFCKSRRYNPKTNHCKCCPFYYEGDYFMGCLLTDSPEDWQLD
jgi:hypothetical protein